MFHPIIGTKVADDTKWVVVPEEFAALSLFFAGNYMDILLSCVQYVYYFITLFEYNNRDVHKQHTFLKYHSAYKQVLEVCIYLFVV